MPERAWGFNSPLSHFTFLYFPCTFRPSGVPGYRFSRSVPFGLSQNAQVVRCGFGHNPPRAKSASVPVWVPVARAGLWFWSPAEKGFDAGRPCCGRHGLPRCSSVHGQGGSRDVSPAAPNLLPNPARKRSLGAGCRVCLRACRTSNNQQSVRCKHAAPGVGYVFWGQGTPSPSPTAASPASPASPSFFGASRQEQNS